MFRGLEVSWAPKCLAMGVQCYLLFGRNYEREGECKRRRLLSIGLALRGPATVSFRFSGLPTILLTDFC